MWMWRISLASFLSAGDLLWRIKTKLEKLQALCKKRAIFERNVLYLDNLLKRFVSSSVDSDENDFERNALYLDNLLKRFVPSSIDNNENDLVWKKRTLPWQSFEKVCILQCLVRLFWDAPGTVPIESETLINVTEIVLSFSGRFKELGVLLDTASICVLACESPYTAR